jgi:hypothetical protein
VLLSRSVIGHGPGESVRRVALGLAGGAFIVMFPV